MNRSQRRYGSAPKKLDGEVKGAKVKNGVEIEEVLPPKNRWETSKGTKSMTNRSCFVAPKQIDTSQETDAYVPTDYQNLLIEQYGFDPLIPDTIKQIKELKRVLCCAENKVENGSQYIDADNMANICDYIETLDGSQWKNIDNTDQIERHIKQTVHEETKGSLKEPRNIHISDVPRVKLIAEKFSRYKKNNVELRKLDEKVVCLEYDVYDQSSTGDMVNPVQIMRAFFSIKPAFKEENDISETNQLPSEIKRNFKITEKDLQRLNEKEVEIIDEKILENKPYLDDLKKILRRKNTTKKKNKTSLDLFSLYEIAKNEHSPVNILNSKTNLLSKTVLQEVKDLILANCKSSVHGISRRTIRNRKDVDESSKTNIDVISESIVAELLRENGKINVFQ